jgi:hypothetical protein
MPPHTRGIGVALLFGLALGSTEYGGTSLSLVPGLVVAGNLDSLCSVSRAIGGWKDRSTNVSPEFWREVLVERG